jgi:hypothetical protein
LEVLENSWLRRTSLALRRGNKRGLEKIARCGALQFVFFTRDYETDQNRGE